MESRWASTDSPQQVKAMCCGINELELEFAFDQAETDVPYRRGAK